MRINGHPIIEDFKKGKRVTFTFDDMLMSGFEGEPIAAALRAQGVMTHRYTTKHQEARGVFCAIGRCTDCVMIVGGKINTRTCVTPLKEGMIVETQFGIDRKRDVK